MSRTEIQAWESDALVRTSFEVSEAVRSPRIVVAVTTSDRATDVDIPAHASSAGLGAHEASEVEIGFEPARWSM